MCSALRDAIARSPRHELATDEKDAFYVDFISTPAESQTIATSTAIAYHDLCITHLVLYCGSGQINNCATDLLASVDTNVARP